MVTRFVFAGLFTALFAFPNALYGQVKNDPDLYPLTGKANAANRDAMMTWEGVVEINASHAGFNVYAPYYYTTKSEIRFYYDKKQGKLLFNEKTTYYPNGLTGEKFKDAELYSAANGMRTPNGYYEYPKAALAGGVPGYGSIAGMRAPMRLETALTIGKNTVEQSGEGGKHFDPFCFFELSTRQKLDDIFSIWHERAKKTNDYTISKKEDVITISYLAPKFDYRFQIDLKQGANPVRMEMESPGSTETRTREFEKINGIYVPKSATYKQRFNGESKSWEVKWLRQKVNEPLPYDIFSPKNLGVRTGEPVRDLRGAVPSTYPYEEGKIPEGPPNGEPKQRPPQ